MILHPFPEFRHLRVVETDSGEALKGPFRLERSRPSAQ
jgi:hypothetical protein